MKQALHTILIFSIVFQSFAQQWEEGQNILIPEPYLSTGFGSNTTLDGNELFITAYDYGYDLNGENFLDSAGGVFFFEQDASGLWQPVQTIVSPNRNEDDIFGWQTAVSGDFLAISARLDDSDETYNNVIENAGAVYMYERDTSGNFTFVQKLVATDRVVNARFGESIYLEGNMLLIGAHQETIDANVNNPIDNTGAVYMFERDNNGLWSLTQKILASDRSIEDRFGVSVDVDGDTLIVGAHTDGEDFEGLNTSPFSGSAYFFERDASGLWVEVQKITANDRAQDDNFGRKVILYGDYAVIGSFFNSLDETGNNFLLAAGAAYVFKRDVNGVWNELQKLIASDRGEFDLFAVRAIEINDEYIIIGCDNNDGVNDEEIVSGAVFVYAKDEVSGFWSESQILRNNEGIQGERFGFSIDLQNDILSIGSPQKMINGSMVGGVDIYELDSNLSIINNDFAVASVFPNPSNGLVSVRLANNSQKVEMTVSSLMGQIIKKQAYTNTQEFNFILPERSGIYFVSLVYENGQSEIFKIIRE